MEPVPFYHTYILYDPSDVVSTACVQFSLFPIYVMVFYLSWFLVTREIQPVITVGGHIIGEVLNAIIKYSVKQPRPEFHKNFGNGSRILSHGMPSAHSQFMGFFASYFICVLFLQTPVSKIQKYMISMFLVAISACVAFSRVYLQYHTTPQVVVGMAVGILWGLVFSIVSSLARDMGLVDWVLSWRIVSFFSVKDSYYTCYMSFEEEKMRIEEMKNAKAELKKK